MGELRSIKYVVKNWKLVRIITPIAITRIRFSYSTGDFQQLYRILREIESWLKKKGLIDEIRMLVLEVGPEWYDTTLWGTYLASFEVKLDRPIRTEEEWEHLERSLRHLKGKLRVSIDMAPITEPVGEPKEEPAPLAEIFIGELEKLRKEFEKGLKKALTHE